MSETEKIEWSGYYVDIMREIGKGVDPIFSNGLWKIFGLVDYRNNGLILEQELETKIQSYHEQNI